MAKKNTIKQKRDDSANLLAGVFKVTPRYVRMVINGERYNESILSAHKTLKNGKEQLIKQIKKTA